MASEPVPSLQIEPHHRLGMSLVGTVALPSPFPAEGRIFVVRHPESNQPQGGEAKPSYHLKIVQKLSDTHSITRFMALDDMRLIRFSPPRDSQNAPARAGEEAPGPLCLDREQLREVVEAVPWEKVVRDGRCDYEVELYPDRTGVVYVPEQAPVLLRHECAVMAAMSLDTTGPWSSCPRSSVGRVNPQ